MIWTLVTDHRSLVTLCGDLELVKSYELRVKKDFVLVTDHRSLVTFCGDLELVKSYELRVKRDFVSGH